MSSGMGHDTRMSDSSLYDEVCRNCGATDGLGDDRLNRPCSAATQPRATSAETPPPGILSGPLPDGKHRAYPPGAPAQVVDGTASAADLLEQRLWAIIDRNGLGDVPSDIFGAVARLVTLAAEREKPMATGMAALLGDVAAFHAACGVPVNAAPAVVAERVQLRRDILREEWEETDDAMAAGDLVELADGLADLIYVAVGTALEFGIPLDRVWAEVQRSNMAKRDPATGKVRKRADGKVLKPDGWTPPDIAAALAGEGG